MAAIPKNQSALTRLSDRACEDVVLRLESGAQISLGQLFGAAQALADQLPDAARVVNMCASRSGFLLGLVAAMLRGQVTLMPPNRQLGTLKRLQESAGEFTLLGDGPLPELEASFSPLNLDFAKLRARSTVAEQAPRLDDDQVCIVAYTSGSTGESSPNAKSWHTLREGASINRSELLGGIGEGAVGVLATVPSQHMYGFETAVMLPLFKAIELHDRQPFFPEDIARALHQLPGPRVLVSTPVHLRALLRSGVTLPALERILSATAPMTLELAQACETAWDTEVLDTYGCSEAGCLARRRVTQDETWQLFERFSLEHSNGKVSASAEHLPEAIPLPDQIAFVNPRRFKLMGRNCDLVNIAGKRASLTALNGLLQAIEGVEDGVFFLPEEHSDRLTALVVAPELSATELRAALRQQIDPVMLPRPLVFADALPRNATGKLPRQDLLAAWRTAQIEQQAS